VNLKNSFFLFEISITPQHSTSISVEVFHKIQSTMAYFLSHSFKLPLYPIPASSAKRPLGCYAISGEGNGAAVNLQKTKGPVVAEIPLGKIRRPLSRTRANDPQKVEDLMDSIAEIGLQEPIDVLEVDGTYYGFSGCHRFEAHQRLGLPTIRCKIRRGTKETLRHHMR
jgi:sulfiredoxin